MNEKCHSRVPDPVVKKDDGWYFYDESWSCKYGAFETEAEARESFRTYCLLIEGKGYN